MYKNRAIFLDRDGTLIKSIKKSKFKYRPPYNKKEFEIYKDIRILKKFSKSFFLIICTNQPDLKRGLQSREFNLFINNSIKKIIPITEIYSCNCLKTEIKCGCYKPKIGMLLKAKKKYKIDLKRSFMVGDSWRDTMFGKNSGCTTILIDRGQNENLIKRKKFKPDHIIKNLTKLNNIIL